jgi:putative flippase GtrA
MQFMRFAIVGIFNTLIDFGSLNGLLWLNGYPVGWRLLLYNALAFILASGNSYVLNKRWTFGDARPSSFAQIGLFFVLTSIGLLINCAVVYLLTFSDWSPLAVSTIVWVNLAKVAATLASLIWNFCSYRWWVFRVATHAQTGPPVAVAVKSTSFL